jgi:tRNA/rRNA methyltransferase
MTPLSRCAFVLFKPKSPDNAGAAARALKNMGFSDLRLVAPRRWDPARAATMAVHGANVVAAAKIYSTLAEALADRTLVIGTTARAGGYRANTMALRECAGSLAADVDTNRIAIVFGPEDFGLTNEDLKLCQRLLTIPTAPAYPSLNLAQAVMVVAYELMLAADGARASASAIEFAPATAVDAMAQRIAQALIAIGFLPEDNPDHIMFTLRGLFGRAGLAPHELEVLNGIARQIAWFAEGGHETLAAKRRAGKKLR